MIIMHDHHTSYMITIGGMRDQVEWGHEGPSGMGAWGPIEKRRKKIEKGHKWVPDGSFQ